MTRLVPRIMMIAGLAVVSSAHLGSNAAQLPGPRSGNQAGTAAQYKLRNTILSAVKGHFSERAGELVLSKVIRVDVDGFDSGETVQYQIGTTKERTRVFVPVRGDLSSFEQAINALDLTEFGPLGEALFKCEDPEERVCVLTCDSGTEERCCKWECR